MKELMASPYFQKALLSLVTLLIAYLLAGLITKIINKQVKDLKKRHSARKSTVYITTLLSILIIIPIWINKATSITTILGLMGAGLTLALHQPILSIAGWLLILIRKPYETGDRVEVGGIKGDIVDIRLFYTSVLEIGNWVDADQSTGRIIHYPNSKVFTESLFNYTKGFEYIWNEIKIVVTFESDWKKAKDIILDVSTKDRVDLGKTVRNKIQRLSKKYMIYYEKLTPFVWTNIVDFGVELTLRYLTDARKRRITQHEICELILDRFNQEPEVEFAYPTYRIFRQGEQA